MRRIYIFITLPLAIILLFCQCNGRNSGGTDGYGKEYPKTKMTIAVIGSSMSFMRTAPARSHHIIDSVCKAKLMSPQR